MPVLRRSWAGIAAAALAVAVAACGGGGKPTSTVTVTQSASASPSQSVTPAGAAPPAMVGVTTAGALVTLNPSTGVVEQTLVPSGVQGDEISVAPSGLVYFAVQSGCTSTIEEMPLGGGNVATIATGSVPAVSPDGTKLAYASQPTLTQGCVPSSTDMTALYLVKIRTLSSGATISLAANPASQDSGLPVPISHLSWSADNQHLAVSIAQAEDNEGWEVALVDTTQAQYFRTGTGVVSVPVTGNPTPQQSYLREGVYMPNGDLFVSRACCAGFPPQNTSRLMWEVDTNGVLVHQVAIGYPNLDHTSLDVSADGQWLLYLAGNDLYVSQGGATPKELTTGLVAAAWA
jgi:WD40-like Beta Propeller Repeat